MNDPLTQIDDLLRAMAVAMCRFAVDVLEIELSDPDVVDRSALSQLDRDLFEEPLELNDVEIDSMGLVEFLASFEAEIDIHLFDADDAESMTTLRGLIEHTLNTASREDIERFLSVWGRSP